MKTTEGNSFLQTLGIVPVQVTATSEVVPSDAVLVTVGVLGSGDPSTVQVSVTVSPFSTEVLSNVRTVVLAFTEDLHFSNQIINLSTT